MDNREETIKYMTDGNESLRVQKTEHIKEQVKRRRDAEDALLAQMLEEQKVLDALNENIDNNLECTKEVRRYNQEFQENINAKIYAMHGISEDTLEGIKAYRNAYYRGCAFSLFLLSVALTALCGILHGFRAQITLFMLAFTGIEGTLIAQEKKRFKLFDLFCKFLYILIFPSMLTLFVFFELNYPEYGMLLPYLSVAGAVALVIGSASYFLYNPYREEKKKVRDARDYIHEMERAAQKEVKKNKKLRVKEEKRFLRRQDRDGKKVLKQQERERKRLEKNACMQQKRLEREEKRREKKGQPGEKKKAFFLHLKKEDAGEQEMPEETENRIERADFLSGQETEQVTGKEPEEG